MKTGHTGADTAMNWLFEHMEDADIDAPIEEVAGEPVLDLGPLMDMGFTDMQAKRALKETNNDMERAVDWLFSHPDIQDLPEDTSTEMQVDDKPAKYNLFAMISHKGTSAQCGHYVAYIKKEDGWVMFNDEKVVQVQDITAAAEDSYVYLYQRAK
jgi:ubiquitin carboxyl-terminal hydrolase 5/13